MKFNFTFKSNKADVVNKEGAKAFALSPELSLYSAVATTMLTDATYEKGNDRLERINALMPQVSPEFVAKLAVYSRKKMNLRSVPVVLAAQLAKLHNGDNLVSKTITSIVERPDEITEMLAYYQEANKRTGTKKLNRVSKQVQKGLAGAFNKFDEYQFAKYNRDAAVTLRDALFLVHPKAKDEAQQQLFNKIVKDELATPYIWETELSALGQVKFDHIWQKEAAVTAKWEELIDSKKLGYMAMLRNLRNILDANVSHVHMQQVGSYLADKSAVEKAKQLPFRFLAAYRELKSVKSSYTNFLLGTLEKALKHSIANMKGFGLEDRVVIACDVSGSMQKPVSPKSKVLLYDIGLLLGMMMQSKCSNVVTGMFGDKYKTVALPSANILSNVDVFYGREGEVGYATNGYLVIQDLVKTRYIADKVLLFTDVQLWDSKSFHFLKEHSIAYQWEKYKAIAPNARLYLFDLGGYGNTPLKMENNDVYLIAGWSDKIFDVMEAMENSENAVSVIEQMQL